jgi:TonB-dependent siderophore receptor
MSAAPLSTARLRPIALAVHLACAAALVAGATTALAQAQPGAAARIHADVPAGPLADALNRFAVQAGVSLAVDADKVKGRASAGLKGAVTVEEGFQRLLAGSGLQLGRTPAGYTLLPAQAAAQPATAPVAQHTPVAAPAPGGGANTLSAVTVSAQAVRDGTSEGSGSYAQRFTDSATRLNLSPRETPQSITVVTRQMIEDKGLSTVEQVLQHTPGVSMVGDASQNSQIFVRGFYMESGIQVDGLNTTSAQPIYEGSISQGLDPAIADRVEVVKGAAGIVAGLGSPSASVNFIRKRPTSEFQASAEASVGSWNRLSGEVDIGGPVNADGSVRARLVTAVRHGNSYIDRYGYDKSVFYGVVDADITPSTTVSLAVDHQRSDTDGAFNYSSNPAFYLDGGTFRPSVSFSTGQDWTYWNVRQTSVTPTLEHRFDNGWLGKIALRHAEASIDRVSFYPGEYVDRSTGMMVGAWGPANADRSLRQSDTDSLDAYATGRFDWLGRKHDLAVGMNYGRNDFSMATYNSDTLPAYGIGTGAIAAPAISSTATYDQLYSQQQAGLFATARFNPTDALKLMLGGRFSNWQHTTDDRANGSSNTVRHNNIFTPYLGVVYELGRNTSLYGSYTGVFRPVTYYGADGKLLEPAEGSNAEIGVKFGLLEDRLNLSLAAYQSKEDNYPEWADQGRLPSGEWIYKSVDGVKTTGFEAELSGRLAPGWEVSGGYTFNRAKDATGAAKLTYVPKHQVKLSLNHKVDAALTLGGSLRWQSSSYYDTTIYAASPSITVRQEQKAYALLDLMARWQFTPRYAVTVNLNNVFNKVYNRSIWGYADYGEPRNVVVSLRAKF